ncbi:PIN domain-like protein [Martensiomyces pterosporus]|nr:PIN domain-like protein [Martensiomyces pterosporus]
MGISGLLPLLRESQRTGHVEEFAGQTVGVDSYIWLYKGVFSCAADLALNKPTNRYVNFFMQRARMLRHYGIEPFFVFDGGPLPSKRETELERKRNREAKRQQGLRLWNQSKRKAAFEQFQRSVEVTPRMAKAVIDELKTENFQYIVAPYEADAQLAYLESQGIITASISEDSDLIVFGCQKVIFKLDQYGAAVIFDRERLFDAKAVDINNWTNAQIRRMCILSGCDYAASVPGVGLKKAHRYTMRATDIAASVSLMRADGLSVPEGYEADVERADLTFLYQRVYDPRAKALSHVTPLDASSPPIEDMPFIGDALEPRVAQGVAEGNVDPFSYEPLGASSDHGAAASPKRPSQAESASPAVRARNLNHFFARPKDKTPSQAVSKSPDKLAQPERENGKSLAGEEQVVQVRFRAKEAGTEIVATKEHSRFFTKPGQSPLATPKKTQPEQQQSLPVWPVTPANSQVEASQISSGQGSPFSLTQVAGLEEELDDNGGATQAFSQCSTVVAAGPNTPRILRSTSTRTQASQPGPKVAGGQSNSTPMQLRSRVAVDQLKTPTNSKSPSARQPASESRSLGSGTERAISLFGQFRSQVEESIPEWAKNPVYKKGNF